MRAIRIALLLAFIAQPVWPQSVEALWARCTATDPDVGIRGCTALVQSGQEAEAALANVYWNRGRAYRKKGVYDQAIADFTQALAIDSSFADAYDSRAWTYHLMGQDAEGLPDAERAVSLEPDNYNGIETRAEIYEKLGRRNEAVADYRAALKIDPNMKIARDGLARLGVAP